jgi:hypothetical protein
MALEESTKTALFGQNSRHRRVTLIAAVVLFFVTHTLSKFLYRQTDLLNGRIYVPVLFIFFGLGGLAVVSSHRNDGLVLSWLVVFLPTLGYTRAMFIQREGLLIEDLFLPLGWSILGAGAVGTLGYGIGSILRRDTDKKEGLRDFTWVLAGNVDVSRWGKIAGLVASVSLLTMSLSHSQIPFFDQSVILAFVVPITILTVSFPLMVMVASLWTTVTVFIGYKQYGMYASWLVTFGAFFGGGLVHFVLGDLSGWSVAVNVTYAFISAVVHSFVIGSLGYLGGYLLRQSRKTSPA